MGEAFKEFSNLVRKIKKFELGKTPEYFKNQDYFLENKLGKEHGEGVAVIIEQELAEFWDPISASDPKEAMRRNKKRHEALKEKYGEEVVDKQAYLGHVLDPEKTYIL